MAIPIARAFVPVEVDLWGELFETVDVPRSGAKKAVQLQAELNQLDEDAQDEAVELIAQIIDLKLTAADGKKTKPSTLIKRKWKADELSVRGLFAFLAEIGAAEREVAEAAVEAINGRPT